MASTTTSAGTLVSAALTTTFSPAPSCTNDFYTAPTYYSIGGPLASECFPSGWASTSQYFSPGICPTGYTEACSSLSTYGTLVETFATCCPTFDPLHFPRYSILLWRDANKDIVDMYATHPQYSISSAKHVPRSSPAK